MRRWQIPIVSANKFNNRQVHHTGAHLTTPLESKESAGVRLKLKLCVPPANGKICGLSLTMKCMVLDFTVDIAFIINFLGNLI
jgi:hypothetical protein